MSRLGHIASFRWLAAASIAAAAAAGCPGIDPYACLDDAQCRLDGEAAGICDPGADRCAYPDDTCDSGFRFPDVTDGGLGGVCTAPPAGTSSTTSPLPATTDSGQTGVMDSSADSSSGDAVDASTTDGCALAMSEPLVITETPPGPIERLVIHASGQPGITVSGAADVHIRDVEIHFSEAAGIVVEDSPGLTIERVSLVNEGSPEPGPADLREYGIQVTGSDFALLRHIQVLDPLTGIQVEDCDDLTVEDFIVENARVQEDDVGGDCLLVQLSERVTIERFGCINDPRRGTAHAGIFVDACTDVLVHDGVVTDVDHQSGAGVRVHTNNGGQQIVVEGVDVVRGVHSCFNVLGGNDVELRRTRCRNMPAPHYGWVGYMMTGSSHVLEGYAYNVDNVDCCGTFETFEVDPFHFVPHTPPVVQDPCAM